MIGNFTNQQIINVAQQFFKEIEVKPIEQGVSSYTYKLITEKGNFYLSTPKTTDEKKSPLYFGLKILDDSGVRVTKPLVYEDFSKALGGYSFIITYELPGKEIKSSTDEILQDAGKNLAIAHSIKIVNGFGYLQNINSKNELVGSNNSYYEHIAETIRYKDSFKNKIKVLEEFKIINSKESSDILNFLNQNKSFLYPETGNLIHGDFSFEHIFANKEGFTGIIDWDGMGSGTRYYDLAQFSTFYPQDEVNSLLKGYSSIYDIRSLDKDFNKRLLLERLIYCTSKTAKGYLRNAMNSEGFYKLAEKKLREDLELI